MSFTGESFRRGGQDLRIPERNPKGARNLQGTDAMRFRLPLFLMLLLCTFVPRAVSASPLTWAFSGVVDKVTGSGWTAIDIGALVDGWVGINSRRRAFIELAANPLPSPATAG